jgi:hypothetical protein
LIFPQNDFGISYEKIRKKPLVKSSLLECKKWKNRLNNLRKNVVICQRIGMELISGEIPPIVNFEAKQAKISGEFPFNLSK